MDKGKMLFAIVFLQNYSLQATALNNNDSALHDKNADPLQGCNYASNATPSSDPAAVRLVPLHNQLSMLEDESLVLPESLYHQSTLQGLFGNEEQLSPFPA
jgi:hypothetical protein